jgi:hypothetical protein
MELQVIIKMESVTVCPVCVYHYDHKEKLPLILGCGHTFCKMCVSQFASCPMCRRHVNTTATNLLVF